MHSRSLNCRRPRRGRHAAACVRARYKSNVYESRLEASWEPPCHLQRPSLHVCRQQTQMQKKVSRSTIAATRLHPQFGLKLPLLKVASEEIIPLPCKCSILLGLTFVEIKNSFTKTLLVFNSKNFRIICYWKKTDESEPI